MATVITRLARTMAIIGGLVLTALILLTCVSVVGRLLNTALHSAFMQPFPELSQWLLDLGLGPVTGDFELVESGVAFAIFAFLPYCQLRGGHATVDVFTSLMPDRVNRVIIAFWEVVLTLVILLVTWRLYEGLLSKFSNGETTFLLRYPIWWAYLASLVAAVVASIVGLYCAYARVAGLVSGRDMLPKSKGAIH